jgi:hypothetical protein
MLDLAGNAEQVRSEAIEHLRASPCTNGEIDLIISSAAALGCPAALSPTSSSASVSAS